MKEFVSVSQLLTEVRATLLKEPSLADVRLKGEISNFSRSHASHLYFSLKDRRCQVRCVMFASEARRLRFVPGDGLNVLLAGQVTLYGPRGDLQVQVRAMRVDGQGQLHEALERLKQKLASLGFFEASRKKPLPRYPRTVGVVTSLQGAVLHDIVTTLRRRNPSVSVVVSPAPVQGDEAPRRLARALRRLVARAKVDCIIIARGGGTLEDLMAFNSEQVVRTIAACSVPILSAVGHETDTTLCDLVADCRAPTPTAAAEMVAPPREELLSELSQLARRSRAALESRVQRHRQELGRLAASPSLRYPLRMVEQEMQRVDELTARLPRALSARVARDRQLVDGLLRSPSLRYPDRLVGVERERLGQLLSRLGRVVLARDQRPLLEGLVARLAPALRGLVGAQRQELRGLEGKLEGLSPLKVLDRGYAVVLDIEGRPLTSASRARAGDRLDVRLADGTLETVVRDVRPTG